MAKRKLRANQVFSGKEFLEPNTVLVFEGERLMDLVMAEDAGDDIEFLDGILLPGMINAHCHLELSHLKGIIPRQTGLVDFLGKVISERNMESEVIDAAIVQADKQMWECGVQAVGDICNTCHTLSAKKSSPVTYHSFIEVAGFPPGIAESRYEAAVELLNRFSAWQFAASLTPHAPYSVSPALLRKIDSSVSGSVFSIHNQEAEDENNLFQNRQGDFLRMYKKMGINIDFFSATHKSSLQSWLPFVQRKESLLLVHNVAIHETDLAYLKTWAAETGSGVCFVICARANEYISGMLPPVEMLIQSGFPIAIGTDSLASNDALDPAYEINFLEHHFKDADVSVWLRAACSNGAEALMLNDKFGSLLKGRKPGLVLMAGEKGNREFKRII